MSQDRQNITLYPINNRTIVRKLASGNAPKKVGGLLLPNDKNNETVVRCEVVSSDGTDLDDYLTPRTVVVEADKLTRSVSIQNDTLYILENKDILGIIVKD
jgi:co-chaperonin GroES (HSP10)